jgi:hypothetical protein
MPIKNLTPHGVSLYSAREIDGRDLIFERMGGGWLAIRGASNTRWNPEPTPARVVEHRSEVTTIDVPEVDEYQPGMVAEGVRKLPTRTTIYGEITGLPPAESGMFYIVSLVVVDAARRLGRATFDLLTMGDLIRDPKGEIVGVTSFYRW